MKYHDHHGGILFAATANRNDSSQASNAITVQ